jgi:hypothetical protein
MDHLITYEEAAVFLKNSPLLAPRPDFVRIRSLRKHIVTALKLLVCPQSAIHGWAGLVMGPVMYALLEPTAPFISINNPGNFPVYANFATKAAIKMTDKQFKGYKLLPLCCQHKSGIFPDARLHHRRPIQGLQYTEHDGMKLINECALNHQAIGDIVW